MDDTTKGIEAPNGDPSATDGDLGPNNGVEPEVEEPDDLPGDHDDVDVVESDETDEDLSFLPDDVQVGHPDEGDESTPELGGEG